MTASSMRCTTAVFLVVFVACGAEPPPASSVGGSQSVPGAAATSSSRSVRACDLLDLATATTVIGSGTELPGGDAEQETCVYANPGVAILTIQIGRAQLYDQVTIAQPHTAATIGDRGRYNVQPSGAVAIQFVKGAYSVTISVQPIGSAVQAYEAPLMSAAQGAAGLLP